MALVFNGMELILGCQQRSRAPPETYGRTQRSIPLQLHVTPPPKNDYSYISFPPTPYILSISSGVVIATPPLAGERQRWEPEEEAACSVCVSVSGCDSGGSHQRPAELQMS